MDAAVAALLGAAISAAASLGGGWIQQHHQSRRERERVAADLAIANYKESMDIIKKRGGYAQPLTAFVLFQAGFLELLSQGQVTPAQVKEFKKQQNEIIEILSERP